MTTIEGQPGDPRDPTRSGTVSQEIEELEIAVENSMTGISRLNPEGVFTHVREGYAAMLGYRPHELRGLSWRATVHPDDVDEGIKAYEDMLASGRGEAEIRARRKDGSYFIKQILLVKSLDAAGEFIGHYCFMRDVTDRHVAEQQLRQAQKMEAIGRLAGGVAHDFNNLLTVILGNCETLLHRAEGRPEAAPLTEIQDAAERAAQLTRQLLAFARKQHGRPEVVDLNLSIRDMIAMLSRLIGERITVETSLSPGVGCIRIDPVQLQQVVLNLAINARDAMPEGGELSITTHTAGSPEAPIVGIRVEDTGRGMDSETVRQIFEPFFTTKGAGEGTGLGLATVYGIVHQAGGEIRVDSRPGRGTRFDISFPRLREEAKAERTGAGDALPTQGQGERILVVEDDKSVRRVTVEALHMLGYTVAEASGGQQALELYETTRPRFSLVVTDIVMPGMSGDELARELRRRDPDVRVLLVTGYSSQTELDERILPKPFTPRSLGLAVRNALQDA